MLIRFAAFFMALSVLPSLAADERGYLTGGGAGTSKCTRFLNAMATARQNGGPESRDGALYVVAFAQYLAGFATAFNMLATSTYDIFEEFQTEGRNSVYVAMYAIEPWCASNPTATFDEAIIALIETLRGVRE